MNRQSYLDNITLLSVVYTDVEPMKPDGADFGITIDFERGKSDPVRVFEAMAMMLNSFKQLDKVLVGAISDDLETTMVLEDVEAASITSWVKSKIDKIDDQAIKEFDWKQQVGKYVVKGKYRVLEFLDKKLQEDDTQSLSKLAHDLRRLGMEVPGNKVLLPPEIKPMALIAPLNQIQQAKTLLGPKDKMFMTSDDAKVEVNKRETTPVSLAENITDLKQIEGTAPMVLLVKKPDYLGKSKWEFKNEKNALSAHITDNDWLLKFRGGEVILKPGSSIVGQVHYVYTYDTKGKQVQSDFDICQVVDVLPPNEESLHSLFSEES